MPVLLVIDDEPNVRFSISQVFANSDVRLLEAGTAAEGIRLASEEMPDVILLDIRLGARSGTEVFQDLRQIDPKSLVIFITGHGTAETAIEAMKLGAYDYLVKPLDADRLRNTISQAMTISRMMHVPALVEDSQRPADAPERLIGNGVAMQAVCKQIGRVSAQDINVLILGESGTGKELVARAVYHHSRRSQGPFLAINCAAIPESLLESELFGHEQGAFTGADRRRIGKFEQCHGGTLFLDEVGDMSPGTQAKILRLLQEGKFERVGGSETLSADVRIIAATNQNLEGLIEGGRFRKDLYYRLRGVTIRLPPLRERQEDIAELAHYFLFRFNRELGTSVQSISESALDMLQRYNWPGNVRELQSVIRESLIASAGPTILANFLPMELSRDDTSEPDRMAEPLSVSDDDWLQLARLVDNGLKNGTPGLYYLVLDHLDRLVLSRALAHTAGNQAQAAELIGLSRPTLRAKLRKLQLTVQKSVTSSVRK
jgi:two-component system nitrogen regulation response regulator GlnG